MSCNSIWDDDYNSYIKKRHELSSSSVPCIICDNPVYLTNLEASNLRDETYVKVCSECKAAILKLKEKN